MLNLVYQIEGSDVLEVKHEENYVENNNDNKQAIVNKMKRFMSWIEKTYKYLIGQSIKRIVSSWAITFVVSFLLIILYTYIPNWFTATLYYSSILISAIPPSLLLFRMVDYIKSLLYEFHTEEIWRYVRYSPKNNLHEYREEFIKTIEKDAFFSKSTNFKKDIFMIEQLAMNKNFHELRFALSALESNNPIESLSQVIKYLGAGTIVAIYGFVNNNLDSIPFIESINSVEYVFSRMFIGIIIIIIIMLILALFVEHKEKSVYRLYFKEAIRIKESAFETLD